MATGSAKADAPTFDQVVCTAKGARAATVPRPTPFRSPLGCVDCACVLACFKNAPAAAMQRNLRTERNGTSAARPEALQAPRECLPRHASSAARTRFAWGAEACSAAAESCCCWPTAVLHLDRRRLLALAPGAPSEAVTSTVCEPGALEPLACSAAGAVLPGFPTLPHLDPLPPPNNDAAAAPARGREPEGNPPAGRKAAPPAAMLSVPAAEPGPPIASPINAASAPPSPPAPSGAPPHLDITGRTARARLGSLAATTDLVERFAADAIILAMAEDFVAACVAAGAPAADMAAASGS